MAMGKSLYRSYRSKSFDEIVGQDHIVRSLKNALAHDAISHAYLLSGPRGVGKTSVARILAYAVNGHEYDLESSHLDIIEIDAASNRRIDEIREIREKVQIAPTSGKYKVYIIDEVHMLTKEAFNALLKTLEEPPAHAIFILATTETHKVPETILSRCIRFTFKPIDDQVITSHILMIANQEKIKLSPEAAALIAEHARGSFRDAISLLDQVKFAAESITEENVREMLGLAPKETIQDLIAAIFGRNTAEIATLLETIFSNGADIGAVCSQIQRMLRDIIISGHSESIPVQDIMGLINNLLYVPGSPKPRLSLELALMQSAIRQENDIPHKVSAGTMNLERVKKAEPKPSSDRKPDIKTVQQKSTAEPAVIKPVTNRATAEKVPISEGREDAELWSECLKELKKINNTLYGVARMAEVRFDEGTAYLSFKFAFHQKKINDTKNRAIISELLQGITGKEMEIVTSLSSKDSELPVYEDPGLQNVSNIFGGHEVLES